MTPKRGELVGNVLLAFPDNLESAARDLTCELLGGMRRAEARGRGVDPALIEALDASLPRETSHRLQAISEGIAWAEGRLSAPAGGEWDLVLTGNGDLRKTSEINRGTAETLIGLISEARSRVRACAPFADSNGLKHIADSLAVASSRGVEIRLVVDGGSPWTAKGLHLLKQCIAVSGDSARFQVRVSAPDGPWPHLKVLIADATAAYVGSANMTAPGLVAGNVELGVLVRGPRVKGIDALLDTLERAGTVWPEPLA